MPAQRYALEPFTTGQLNLAYFELPASIRDPNGEEVGLCFVELLPGVRNTKINPLLLFKPEEP